LFNTRKFIITNLSKNPIYVDHKFIGKLQSRSLRHKSCIIIDTEVYYFTLSKESVLEVHKKELEKFSKKEETNMKKKKVTSGKNLPAVSLPPPNTFLKDKIHYPTFQIPDLSIQTNMDNILDDLIDSSKEKKKALV
jgi:hypothetical protein